MAGRVLPIADGHRPATRGHSTLKAGSSTIQIARRKGPFSEIQHGCGAYLAIQKYLIGGVVARNDHSKSGMYIRLLIVPGTFAAAILVHLIQTIYQGQVAVCSPAGRGRYCGHDRTIVDHAFVLKIIHRDIICLVVAAVIIVVLWRFGRAIIRRRGDSE